MEWVMLVGGTHREKCRRIYIHTYMNTGKSAGLNKCKK